MNDKRIDLIRNRIRDIPDFPKPGIVFKDITPLLADPEAFAMCLDLFRERFQKSGIDAIVGIESRGFIFGGALATDMHKRFVPARKPGKLPAETVRVEYELEYGTDALEIHRDAVEVGERVLIIDDLIATGGTAAATVRMAQKLEAEIVECAFLVELEFLNGRDKIPPGLEVFSILKY